MNKTTGNLQELIKSERDEVDLTKGAIFLANEDSNQYIFGSLDDEHNVSSEIIESREFPMFPEEDIPFSSLKNSEVPSESQQRVSIQVPLVYPF
jgi:hypothetical protein